MFEFTHVIGKGGFGKVNINNNRFGKSHLKNIKLNLL